MDTTFCQETDQPVPNRPDPERSMTREYLFDLAQHVLHISLLFLSTSDFLPRPDIFHGFAVCYNIYHD